MGDLLVCDLGQFVNFLIYLYFQLFFLKVGLVYLQVTYQFAGWACYLQVCSSVCR